MAYLELNEGKWHSVLISANFDVAPAEYRESMMNRDFQLVINTLIREAVKSVGALLTLESDELAWQRRCMLQEGKDLGHSSQ